MRVKPATEISKELLDNFLSSSYWPINQRLPARKILEDKIARAIRRARIEGKKNRCY